MMPAECEVLCETNAADDSIATMQFSHEYVSSETEIGLSYIVFPASPVNDLVPDAESVEEVVRYRSTPEMSDDDPDHFHKEYETSPFSKTDSVTEKMPKCTVVECKQPELSVPCSRSVIVCSDMYAQSDADLEHLSQSLVDNCITDSVRITETQFSEQDESSLNMIEEHLCDNVTVVCQEKNVESCRRSVQPSSDTTESESVDLPEQSPLLDSNLLAIASTDELQTDDNMEQSLLLCATVESTVIEMRLSDENDTLIVRPEQPEMGTDDVRADDDFIQEQVGKVIKVVEVDREESEAVLTHDSQPRELESVKSEETHPDEPQNEDKAKSSADLPWSLLFADLLGDDSSESVTISGCVSKKDNGSQDIETTDMDQQAVTDDKLTESSAAWKSSVVTRRVQKVSSDGKVVERVKSEEVPMSFAPALMPYIFGGDLPSPPDFSPQSDDRQSSTSSIKVYTDTFEGEPWSERRVEEVQETQMNGETVTRKVVRVRKRRTIIKHIVIEGPEFEEMIIEEPEQTATTAKDISSELRAASNVEEDLDEHLMVTSERKPSLLQSDTDSAAIHMSVEDDVTMSNEDYSHTELRETEHNSVDKLRSYAKERTNERAVDDDDDDASSLPLQHTSAELTCRHVSSSASLLDEAKHYGESLDLERVTSSSVGDGVGVDYAESVTSSDIATGILTCRFQPYITANNRAQIAAFMVLEN